MSTLTSHTHETKVFLLNFDVTFVTPTAEAELDSRTEWIHSILKNISSCHARVVYIYSAQDSTHPFILTPNV